MAILLKVEIRYKIAVELYDRPMSPKGFFEQFGGGTLERVAQHFAVLEEHAWLRRTGRRKKDDGRRGPPETLYRATELPFIDVGAWSILPYSVRLAFSWGAFTMAARELRDGLEDAAAKGSPARNLTCVQLEVDEATWKRIIARLADDFRLIFREQKDAERRVARRGGELRRAGILQFGFESPTGDEPEPPHLIGGSAEPPISFLARGTPIFADELAMRIVAELNRSELSVRQFHRRFADGVSEGAVRYRFERLKDLAWIAPSGQTRKRGAPERLYRATGLPPSRLAWGDDVPDALRGTTTWRRFERFATLVEEALRAGTFDLREDRHLSWSLINLDAEGWRNVTRRLAELAAFVRTEEAEARERIADGAKPVTMVVALAAVRQSRVRVSRAP